MADLIHLAPVKSEPTSLAIKRMEVFVCRMERRYECSSDVMEREVHEGRYRETREVGKWLAEYHLLTRLRVLEVAGSEAGSALTSTG